MATRRVKFVGKTGHKRDNVCNSRLFWPYRGAILEVPEDVAVRLFAHPDVWVEPEDDDEGRPMSETVDYKLSGNLTRDDKIKVVIDIIESEDCLLEVMAHFGIDDDFIPETDGTEGINDIVDSVSGPGLSDVSITELEEETSDPGEESGPAAVVSFSPDPQEAIVQAINMLDRDNKDHFTDTGMPRVEAISGLLGYTITAQQRTVAWDTVQESEGN